MNPEFILHINTNFKEKVVHKKQITQRNWERGIIIIPSRNESFIHVISSSKLGLLNSPMIFL